MVGVQVSDGRVAPEGCILEREALEALMGSLLVRVYGNAACLEFSHFEQLLIISVELLLRAERCLPFSFAGALFDLLFFCLLCFVRLQERAN